MLLTLCASMFSCKYVESSPWNSSRPKSGSTGHKTQHWGKKKWDKFHNESSMRTLEARHILYKSTKQSGICLPKTRHDTTNKAMKPIWLSASNEMYTPDPNAHIHDNAHPVPAKHNAYTNLQRMPNTMNMWVPRLSSHIPRGLPVTVFLSLKKRFKYPLLVNQCP